MSGGPGVAIAKLRGAVTAVASNTNGSVIAAATGSSVVVWAPGEGTRPVRIPHGSGVDAIAVSQDSTEFIAECTTKN